MHFCFVCMCLCLPAFAVPPREIPSHLYDKYSLEESIPINDWYLDGTYSADRPIIYTTDQINRLIYKAEQRQSGYYGATDQYLYKILDKYLPQIKDSN